MWATFSNNSILYTVNSLTGTTGAARTSESDAYSLTRRQIVLLPKLSLNFQGSMISLLDIDTTAIDDAYSPYALGSSIGDFRDTDFPHISAARMFADRCEYLFAHLCP